MKRTQMAPSSRCLLKGLCAWRLRTPNHSVLHHSVVRLQEDVHQDEAYTDGPSNSALPDHWRDFSEAAAAAGRSSSSSATAAAGRRALTHQDSQVMGLTGMPAAAAQPAGADAGKVSS